MYSGGIEMEQVWTGLKTLKWLVKIVHGLQWGQPNEANFVAFNVNFEQILAIALICLLQTSHIFAWRANSSELANTLSKLLKSL